MKIEVDTIRSVFNRLGLPEAEADKYVEQFVAEQETANAAKEAEKEPAENVAWEWVTYESKGTFWSLQVDSEQLDKIPALIEKARIEFNLTKNGRKSPIPAENTTDLFETIPAKIWKKLRVRVKTKEPTFYVASNV